MKRICMVLLCGCLFLFSSVPALAASSTDQQYDILDDLPNSVSEYLQEADSAQEAGVINAFIDVLNDIFSDFSNMIGDPVRIFAIMCIVMICCSVAGQVNQKDQKIPQDTTITLVGSLAIAAAVSGTVLSSVSIAIETIDASTTFVNGFIPVFTGIMISSGQSTSAAVLGGGVITAASAASAVITMFIHPLTGIMIGLALVSGLTDNNIPLLVAGLRKSVMWVLGIITSVFVGLMGIQGSITGSADNMAVRTTRYLATNSIPVIGRSVSEAVVSVSGSFKIIKATVGSAGIIALCVLFLPCIIKVMLCAMSMSMAAMIGDVMGVKGIAASIRAVRGSLDIVSAILCFYFIALSVCTAIMINAGGG